MIEAFARLSRFFGHFKIKNVEIVIRCRGEGAEYAVAAALAYELHENGTKLFSPPLDGVANSGTIAGIPFTIEAAPVDG